MIKHPKVLVAAPISEHKEYCFDFYAQQVLGFDYDNYEVLLVDNSQGTKFRNKIKAKGIKVIHLPRKKQMPNEFICSSMNKIRNYFLKGDYDFLFILETDVFVPKDTITYLVNHNLPVHNIPYFIDGKKGRSICIQALNERMQRSLMLSPQSSTFPFKGTINQFVDNYIDNDTKLIGSGYGCTMIQRDVVRVVKFRLDFNHRNDGDHIFPDTFFHFDLNTLGISNYLNTERIAQHYNSKW